MSRAVAVAVGLAVGMTLSGVLAVMSDTVRLYGAAVLVGVVIALGMREVLSRGRM